MAEACPSRFITVARVQCPRFWNKGKNGLCTYELVCLKVIVVQTQLFKCCMEMAISNSKLWLEHEIKSLRGLETRGGGVRMMQ